MQPPAARGSGRRPRVRRADRGAGRRGRQADDDARAPTNGRQLVYNGHPLYTLTADVRPGQINGEGFLGTWYVISPAGKRIGKLSHSASEY